MNQSMEQQMPKEPPGAEFREELESTIANLIKGCNGTVIAMTIGSKELYGKIRYTPNGSDSERIEQFRERCSVIKDKYAQYHPEIDVYQKVGNEERVIRM